MNSDVLAPPSGGFFLGVSDEVDAASGARGDRRRDPDGDDGDTGNASCHKLDYVARNTRAIL